LGRQIARVEREGAAARAEVARRAAAETAELERALRGVVAELQGEVHGAARREDVSRAVEEARGEAAAAADGLREAVQRQVEGLQWQVAHKADAAQLEGKCGLDDLEETAGIQEQARTPGPPARPAPLPLSLHVAPPGRGGEV